MLLESEMARYTAAPIVHSTQPLSSWLSLPAPLPERRFHKILNPKIYLHAPIK
jgi:hypothetical protein